MPKCLFSVPMNTYNANTKFNTKCVIFVLFERLIFFKAKSGWCATKVVAQYKTCGKVSYHSYSGILSYRTCGIVSYHSYSGIQSYKTCGMVSYQRSKQDRNSDDPPVVHILIDCPTPENYINATHTHTHTPTQTHKEISYIIYVLNWMKIHMFCLSSTCLP